MEVTAAASASASAPTFASTYFGATTPARISRAVMLGAGVTWLAVQLAFRGVHDRAWWVTLLEHAAEGGLVGGLCDWFAISRVYSAALSNFTKVADGLSDVVIGVVFPSSVGAPNPHERIRELLDAPKTRAAVVDYVRRHAPDEQAVSNLVRTQWNARISPLLAEWLASVDLRAKLLGREMGPSLLDQPAVRHALERCLRGVLADERRTANLRDLLVATGRDVKLASFVGVRNAAETRERVRELYDEHSRDTVIQWLMSVDLRGALRTSGANGGLLQDETIRRVIAHNLRLATKDKERTGRLHAAVVREYGEVVLKSFFPFDITVARVANWFLDEEELHGYVSKIADVIEGPPTQGGAALQGLLQEYTLEYLKGWHDLSEPERRKAAERIHDKVLPEVLDSMVDTLFDAMNTTTVEQILEKAVSPKLVHDRLNALADWLARPDRTSSSEWSAALREYAGAWLETWGALDVGVRRTAARQLVELTDPLLVGTVSDALWSVREQIVQAGGRGTFADIGWVRELAEILGDQLAAAGNVREKGRNALAEYLRSLDPEAVVHELRRHTQEPLDRIQLNGAVLGLGLGSAAGAVVLALG